MLKLGEKSHELMILVGIAKSVVYQKQITLTV